MLQDVLLPFLMIFGFLAFAGWIAVLEPPVSGKRRTEGFKEQAEQMGLQFVDSTLMAKLIRTLRPTLDYLIVGRSSPNGKLWLRGTVGT